MNKKVRLCTDMNESDPSHPKLSVQIPTEECLNPTSDMQLSVEIGGNRVELALNEEPKCDYDKMLEQILASCPSERACNFDDMPEDEIESLLACLSNSSDDASGSYNKVSLRNVRGWSTPEVHEERERRAPSRPRSREPSNTVSVTISIRYANECHSDATQDLSLMEERSLNSPEHNRALEAEVPSTEPLNEQASPLPSSENPQSELVSPQLVPHTSFSANSVPSEEVLPEIQPEPLPAEPVLPPQPRYTLPKPALVNDQSNQLRPSGRKHQWYTGGDSRIYCHMKEELEDSPMYYLDYFSLTDRCPSGSCSIRPEAISQQNLASRMVSVQRLRSRRTIKTGKVDISEKQKIEPKPIGRKHQWYTCGDGRIFCHMKEKQESSPIYYLDYFSLTDRCPYGLHSFRPEKESLRCRSEKPIPNRAVKQKRSRTLDDDRSNQLLPNGRRHQWFTCGDSRIYCHMKGEKEGSPFCYLNYLSLTDRCPHGSCRFETEANPPRCQSEERGVQKKKLERRSRTAVGNRNNGNFVPIGRRYQWYTNGGSRIYCRMKSDNQDSHPHYLDYFSLTDRCPAGLRRFFSEIDSRQSDQ